MKDISNLLLLVYRIKETDAEIEARLDKWDKYLEEPDNKEDKDKLTESQPQSSSATQ